MASEDLERNKAVVRSYIQAMNEQDITTVLDLLTDDFRLFMLSVRQYADRGAFTAIEQQSLGGGLWKEPLHIDITLLTAEEDRVAALCTGRAVTLDDGVYDQMYHLLYTLRDGKICELAEYSDTKLIHDLLRQTPDGSIGMPDHVGAVGGKTLVESGET
jgi:ketosteroid isomerase-like protein